MNFLNTKIKTLFFIACLLSNASTHAATKVTGEMKIWHPITITIDGPSVDESESTFRNYRLDVTFTKGTKSYKVPGFFAADGNAAETSATSGNKWRVIFTPDEDGEWNYNVAFRQGLDIAISFDPAKGTAVSGVNGLMGKFKIVANKKKQSGFYTKGMLKYVGEHYGQFVGDKEWHIKAGPGSPEDLFGYKDFDNTSDWQTRRTKTQQADSFLVKLNGEGLHYFTPHIKDWKNGDPTWKNGKGKGIIGALNYMASIGVNSLYMIPFTINDDSDNTWPWTSRDQNMSYDVSKLAQWDIVFSHMDRVGISPTYYLCESDNSMFLDKGDMILKYPIYYREVIARFGYHLGIRINIGEETLKSIEQQDAACKQLSLLDPYNKIVGLHSKHTRDSQLKLFDFMLGKKYCHGPHYQLHGNEKKDHLDLVNWRSKSEKTGHKWIVANDESWGIDNTPKGEDRMLTYAWRTYMAGAEGMYQYTAYDIPEIGDITIENFRLIENTQKILIACKNLFLKPEINPHLPQMKNENTLVDNPTGNDAPFCLAQKGEIYIVYRTSVAIQKPLNLTGVPGVFNVKWYNAKNGGDFQNGSVTSVTGGGSVHLGNPPSYANESWAILITKSKNPCASEKNISVSTTGVERNPVSGARKYCVNTTAALTANASSGSEFVNWTENGIIVSTQNPYLFTVTTDRSLVANFSKRKVTTVSISTTESSNADGKTNGGGDYNLGETITVSANANSCYKFENWTENAVVVSTEANYKFKVNGARNLKANFTAKTFTVEAEPAIGGKVSGDLTYVCGAVISINATPNIGYRFDGWYANDKLISTQLKDDINIESEYQLEARFSQIKTR